MKLLKKTIIAFLLAMLLMFSLANMTKASTPSPLPNLDSTIFQDGGQYVAPTQNLTEQDKLLEAKALQFLTNVFKLKTSSYNTTVLNISPAPFGVFMTLGFRSAGNEFHVLTEFSNGELIWCMLNPVKGSPAYITPSSSDVLNTAKDTLDKIQAFSQKDYLPTMRSMLNTVSELQNSKITAVEFTQKIAVKENDVTIMWEPSANGLSNQQNRLMLEFKDGNLVFFANFLDIYTIGSADVKISEQEAIQIAIKHTHAYSWEQGNETVSNVTVLGNLARASLSLQNRGNATLYPLWSIKLPLEKMYPGGVTSFHVSIWADTGEVSYITPIGTYGVPNSVPSESPAANMPSTQASSEYTLMIVTALVAAAIVILGYLFYKRKR
jgi:hypothetical protein